jgi:hypothetical protein
MDDHMFPALTFLPRELLWGMRQMNKRNGAERKEEVEETRTDTEQHPTLTEMTREQG